MKRLSLPILASRRQRGFFRVTALLFSAGLVSAGIIKTQQVKAHQASHAKHGLALRKPAVKDCGCRLFVSKPHTARLFQADGDGSNYEQAVSLQAGQRLALGVSDPAGSILPGGAWASDFGTVDANGLYTAPRFTPPEGLDRLHYTDSNNSDVWITIRILPNTAIPGSAKIPFTTFDYVQRTQSAVPKAPFTSTAQVVVVLPGDAPALPLKIAASGLLKARKVSGKSVLTLPAIRGGGDTTAAVYGRPLGGTPYRVTLVPDVTPPTDPGMSGKESIYGPDIITSAPQKGTIDLADGTVGVEAANGAGNVLIKRTIAEFHVQGQSYNWKRTHIRYDYVYLDKKWKLESVLHCDAWTLSLITNPPGAVIAEGYPQNNQPFLPYGPDACHN